MLLGDTGRACQLQAATRTDQQEEGGEDLLVPALGTLKVRREKSMGFVISLPRV